MKDQYIIIEQSGLYLTDIGLLYSFGDDRKEAILMSGKEADKIINDIKSMKLKKEAA